MDLNYRISLWNYFHYHQPGSLEKVIDSIREAGYGVEIWERWFQREDLFGPLHRKRLQNLIGDIPSSLHAGGSDTIEQHENQIKTAVATDSDVIVVHPNHLRLRNRPDYEFAQKIVDMAVDNGIVMALENSPLEILTEALKNLDNLEICLDVGHIYFTDRSMKEFVDSLKHDICHLHIQDTLGEIDHYVPGSGIIPESDWRYLFNALEEVGFEGAAVFEIRPRNPLQHAQLADDFLQRMV